MAKIKNYLPDNNITDKDIVIGSDGDASGVTKNFNVGTLKQHILEDVLASFNLQEVTDEGNTTTNEIVIQGVNNELAIYDNALVFSSDLGAPLLVGFAEQENTTVWSFPNDESLDSVNFKLFASREWVADQVLVKNVTYSELVYLRNNNSLTKNKVYLLTDYMTTYTQPVTNVTKSSGVIEPLYITATDVNKLHNECRSKLYPQDIVYYNIDDDTEGFTKGKIYRRIDTLRNNDKSPIFK